MRIMRIWKYILPSIFACIFVALSELGYYYLILPVLLAANYLNTAWGEFSNREILDELRMFYGCPATAMAKRVSAILLCAMIVWGISFVDRTNPPAGQLLLFSFCTGCLTGCFIVTLAHDLLHSHKKADIFISGMLLTAAGIPHLAADHVAGHHRDVGLSKDPNISRINQSFYSYFVRLAYSRLKESFLTQYGLPKYLSRKILFLNLKMLAILAGVWITIALCSRHPQKTLVFFLFQSFIAYLLYELINYIQHYGLFRKDEQEDITLSLSWNCYYKYTNYILHLLPLHSIHHLPHHKRKIDVSQLKDGPRMPYLYFVMVLMALVPPLWFHKMNKLVLQYNEEPENR